MALHAYCEDNCGSWQGRCLKGNPVKFRPPEDYQEVMETDWGYYNNKCETDILVDILVDIPA